MNAILIRILRIDTIDNLDSLQIPVMIIRQIINFYRPRFFAHVKANFKKLANSCKFP